MLHVLIPILQPIKGKSKNVCLVASVVTVAIQESCLNSRHFYAFLPASFKVSSICNVKDLVLSVSTHLKHQVTATNWSKKTTQISHKQKLTYSTTH